jgi:prostaglandin-E synthase 1
MNLLNAHIHPAFAVYALTCLILIANLLFLWAYSGAVRGKTKTAINHEDSDAFKAKLVDTDPPEVARALRAHANAEALIYPFLILGLLYVLMGGSAGTAGIFFGLFTLSRLLHSLFYLAAVQPARTIAFAVSGLTAIALLIDVAWMLVQMLTAA